MKSISQNLWIFQNWLFRMFLIWMKASYLFCNICLLNYLLLGGYYCDGRNEIAGEENIVKSQKIVVDVIGKPQFLNLNEPVVGYQNTVTVIEAFFCSDPPPKHVEWMYDGLTQHTIE